MSAWLLLLALPAFAAAPLADELPPTFCTPARQLEPPSKVCQDNAGFVRAAELCLRRLRDSVSAEGSTVTRFFRKGTQDRQSQQYHDSSADHAQASRRLARLIRLAKQVALELDTYYDHVYYPVDYELLSVNGGDPTRYVMQQPCYGDTVHSLEGVIDDVVRVGRELTAAKKAADSIHGRLDGREKAIGATLGQKAAHGKVSPTPLARVPAGKNPHRGSTITGKIRARPSLK